MRPVGVMRMVRVVGVVRVVRVDRRGGRLGRRDARGRHRWNRRRDLRVCGRVRAPG